MSSNSVQINGSDELTWEVPDSHIDVVIAMLNGQGVKIEPKAQDDEIDMLARMADNEIGLTELEARVDALEKRVFHQ